MPFALVGFSGGGGMNIKAIETRYKGYRFRSRLEARWAVFFDALNFDWEYESEGFVLSDGTHYLPDFRVKTPQGKDVWYEIKPSGILSDEKFDLFQAECGGRSALLSGDPLALIERGHNIACPRCGIFHRPEYGSDLGQSEIAWGCVWCDVETPSGSGNPQEVGMFNIPVMPHKGFLLVDFNSFAFYQGIICKSAEKARSVRFEHGEVPA